MMGDNTIIRTRGLARDYTVGSQTVHALRDLNLTITEGEFVAIMGPSGSGKSTCMHLLGCLETPSAGLYELDGDDIGGLSADGLAEVRQHKVGFVFQSFNLLAGASAQRNVEMPLLYGATDRGSRKDRAAEALEAVGLSDRAHHLSAQLSGGQMQRVAIARAIVNRPALLLADEPTGALDTATGQEIMNLFQGLNDRGITIIVVTHEREVASFARRILEFRDGRLMSDEPVFDDFPPQPMRPDSVETSSDERISSE
jgi:putative ABC transport system ATP-binding protein